MRATLLAAIGAALLLTGAQSLNAQTGHDLFQQALVMERANGELQNAITLYERIAEEFIDDRELVARALVQMGLCYEKLGSTEAESAYQRVVREFADQGDPVARAQSRLAALQRAALAAEPADIAVRRVWAGPEAQAGTPSPDGRTLVHDGSGVLTVRDLATGESRHITRDSNAYDPKVSPDGRVVAYGWAESGEEGHVRLASIDGSEARVLHAEAACDVGPQSWSSDSRHLLVYRACEESGQGRRTLQLARVSVRDGTTRVLKDFGQAPFYGRRSFSPDDRFVAYDLPVGHDDGSYDIWLLAVDGSRDAPLIQNPANDRLVGWIPGTDEMLFLSNRSGTWDAWTIRVSNGAVEGVPRVVTRRVGEVDPAGFTSDGRLFYSTFTRWISLSIAPVDLTAGTLDVESAVSIPGSNCQPMWSRNGRYLAYWNEQEGPGGPGAGGPVGYRHLLHVRDVTSGEVRELATHLDIAAQGWSPSGQSVLVAGWDRESDQNSYNGALYMIDIASGEATSVLAIPQGVGWWHGMRAVLSLDGSAIIYAAFNQETGEGQIVWYELESESARTLYRHPGLAPMLLNLNPDGRRLLFAIRDSLGGNPSVIYSGGRLMVMDLETGDVSELHAVREQGQVESLQWAHDGRDALFSRRESGAYHVWRVSAEVGSAERLFSYGRGPFRISPDGRQAAYCGIKGASEVWVMENLKEALARRR
jgi:Tol biopolymer transport system component